MEEESPCPIEKEIREIRERLMIDLAKVQETAVGLFDREELDKLISPNFVKLFCDFDALIETYLAKLSSTRHCFPNFKLLFSFWESKIKAPFVTHVSDSGKPNPVVNNDHFRLILFVR